MFFTVKLPKDFSKEGILMAPKHITRCFTSLIIRELQITIEMRCHFTPIRMAIAKKEKEAVSEDVESLELLFTAGENVKWCKTVRRFFK